MEPPPHYGYRRVWALLVRAGIEASLRENAALAQHALGKALRDASGLGLPNQGIQVKSDQGSAFKSQPFIALLTQHGCGQHLGAVGRPEGMGRVECFHRSLKEECLQFEEVESLEELYQLCA